MDDHETHLKVVKIVQPDASFSSAEEEGSQESAS